MSKTKLLSITLRKSLIGCRIRHKACALGLGLRKIGKAVKVIDTPENRGMVKKISYMVSIRSVL